jgi:hypothetical protein
MNYDSKTHTYYLDGIKIPSVTQVLKVLNPNKYKHVKKDYLLYKADIGTKAHKIIEEYIKGDYDWTNYDSRATNYLTSYKRFTEEYNAKPLFSELMLIDRDLKFGGTLDLVMESYGQTLLVDIKTCKFSKEHYIQVSAYKYLFDKYYRYVNKCCILYLEYDNYYVKEVDNTDYYFEVFQSLLNIYNFKKRRIK